MSKIKNRSRALVIVGSVMAVLVTGCATTEQNTMAGAGIGAVVGNAIGKNSKGTAIGGALGALGGYVWSRQMQEKRIAMERATAGTGVVVTQTPDNQLMLNIPSDISFDVNRAEIKPNLRPILDQFASGLNNQPSIEVRVIGHTDNTGPDSVNDPLSYQRAASTRSYLAMRGVDPNRIAISGRGEHEPIADNATEYGRARNRRVEIFLAERPVAYAPQPQPVAQPYPQQYPYQQAPVVVHPQPVPAPRPYYRY
jgi:outer membrane protein OmpA-like peptidoglycan-associated protein